MPESAHPPAAGSDAVGAYAVGAYLGFDYGSKRIGAAVGNTVTGSVTTLSNIRNDSGTPDWASIEALILEWDPAGLIVGDPVGTHGETLEITPHARSFARRLGKRTGLPVAMQNEVYTTREANDLLHQRHPHSKRKTRKQDTDRIAAAFILQRWLDERYQRQ